MVYDRKDNKTIILQTLKNKSVRISGEELSRITSISRVGVWKHINSLKEHGYDIDSNRNGYLLKKGNDLLQKWEFPQYKNRISFYTEIGSTMIKAREAALAGAADRTIIAAERQTAGINRKGKKWESDEGGLYFTIILRPGIPLSSYNLICLAAAAGVNNYLSSINIESYCSWPNKILIRDKKISGILTEVSGTPDRIEYALVGIGMNINNSSSGISLNDILKHNVPRNEVLNSLLAGIFEIFDSEFSSIPELWSSASSLKNRKLKFKAGSKTISGIFKSVTREGNLLIETEDGNEKIIFPCDERID